MYSPTETKHPYRVRIHRSGEAIPLPFPSVEDACDYTRVLVPGGGFSVMDRHGCEVHKEVEHGKTA